MRTLVLLSLGVAAYGQQVFPPQLAGCSGTITPATYGDSTHVGQFAVSANGCITSAANVGITGTGGVGTPGYTGTFTGTTVTVPASTHNQGAHPVIFLYGSNGHATSADYYCLDGSSALVGCAATTSAGNLVVPSVTNDTYSYQIIGATGGFPNPLNAVSQLIGSSSTVSGTATPITLGTGLSMSGSTMSTTDARLTANTFTGEQIINTASGTILDLKTAGVEEFNVNQNGDAQSNGQIIAGTQFVLAADYWRIVSGAQQMKAVAPFRYGWTASSSTSNVNLDTAFVRDSAAVIDFSDGGANANGSWKATNGTLSGILTLSTLTTPADNATCTAGTIWVDTGFVYVCTASGTVKRATLATY